MELFHGIQWNYTMESTWIVPWSPHGLFHGVHGGYACIPYGIQWNPQGMVLDSTWNDEFHDHSIIIPHGIHDDYGIRKQLRPQPMLIPWTPHGIPDGFHGFHMDSTWNNPGKVKTSPSGRRGTSATSSPLSTWLRSTHDVALEACWCRGLCVP